MMYGPWYSTLTVPMLFGMNSFFVSAVLTLVYIAEPSKNSNSVSKSLVRSMAEWKYWMIGSWRFDGMPILLDVYGSFRHSYPPFFNAQYYTTYILGFHSGSFGANTNQIKSNQGWGRTSVHWLLQNCKKTDQFPHIDCNIVNTMIRSRAPMSALYSV